MSKLYASQLQCTMAMATLSAESGIPAPVLRVPSTDVLDGDAENADEMDQVKMKT